MINQPNTGYSLPLTAGAPNLASPVAALSPKRSLWGPAMLWGLSFGVIITLLDVANNGISAYLLAGSISGVVGSSSTSSPSDAKQFLQLAGLFVIVNIVLFVVTLGLFFLTGMLTARRNGMIGSATIAGAFAGVLGGVLGSLSASLFSYLFIVPATNQAINQAASQTGSTPITPSGSSLAINAVVSAVFLLVLYGGMGAGWGALGGLLGRSSYEKRHPLPQPIQQPVYATPMMYAAPVYGMPIYGAAQTPYPSQQPQQPYPQQPQQPSYGQTDSFPQSSPLGQPTYPAAPPQYPQYPPQP